MANEIRERVDYLLAWKAELQDQLRDLTHRLSVTGDVSVIDAGAEQQRQMASQRHRQTLETLAYVDKELASFGTEHIHMVQHGTDSIGGDLGEYESESLE